MNQNQATLSNKTDFKDLLEISKLIQKSKKGLSASKISEKTGLAIDYVKNCIGDIAWCGYAVINSDHTFAKAI